MKRVASDLARWRRNLQDEVDGAHIYRAMAAHPGDHRLGDLYARMAEAEDRHARLWRDRLPEAAASSIRPSLRARILAFVARRHGASLVAPMIASQERTGRTMYDDQPEAAGTSLPADERSHARLLQAVTGGASGAMLARFEGRHRASAATHYGPEYSERTTASCPTSAWSWASPAPRPEALQC